MKYEINVSSHLEGNKIVLETHDSMRTQITRKIIDLEEEMIRDQLIKLDWTPPKDTNATTN